MVNEYFISETGSVQETLEIYEEIHERIMVSTACCCITDSFEAGYCFFFSCRIQMTRA